MERVYAVEQKPFQEIRCIAVAIRSVDVDQRHIGILHKDDTSNELLILHLAWHHDLRNDPPSPRYLWIDPPIHPARLRQVAAMCRKIWRSNGRYVPYALSPPNDCFDSDAGSFLLGPTRLGLTCATFVAAVFESVGLRLMSYETWPVGRAGDAAWQSFVAEELERRDAAPEHVMAVRGEIGVGAARFRPEEVEAQALKYPHRFLCRWLRTSPDKSSSGFMVAKTGTEISLHVGEKPRRSLAFPCFVLRLHLFCPRTRAKRCLPFRPPHLRMGGLAAADIP